MQLSTRQQRIRWTHDAEQAHGTLAEFHPSLTLAEGGVYARASLALDFQRQRFRETETRVSRRVEESVIRLTSPSLENAAL